MISKENREGQESSALKLYPEHSLPQPHEPDDGGPSAAPHLTARRTNGGGGEGRGGAGPVLDQTAESREAMTLLALSHTPAEHRLYTAMLDEVAASRTRVGTFSVRSLMTLTELRSYSTIRRGLAGLQKKLSIEHQRVAGERASTERQTGVYLIYHPDEIFSRRRDAGLSPYPVEAQAYQSNTAYRLAMGRVIERHDLSRREAQVALCCAEGLTNAEIGEKLYICEETVKFHLRHIFTKLKVKRRTELVSLLLRRDAEHGAAER